LGHDFSRVRVHRDAEAAESARTMSARAYTAGEHVVFGAQQYAPQTDAGRRLIAHELAHTLQQAGGPAVIQRDAEEPPQPVRPMGKTVPFADLKDRQVVSDPTGRPHGIRIERRGDELYYYLPAAGARQVPRPSSKGRLAAIESVTWGPPQEAFSVQYPGELFEPFSVNQFGLARYQKLEETFMRMPATLEVLPGGLELERRPGVLTTGRPARTKDATRYHMPNASYSLYVKKDRSAEVADDASGKSLLVYTNVIDLQVTETGDALLTWNDPVGVVTVQFTLRGPTPSATGLGKVPEPATRTALLSEVRGFAVKIEEKASRFTDEELAAARDVLKSWKGAKPLVESLKALKVPGLTLRKDVRGPPASYSPTTGVVSVPAEYVASVESQRNVVIHELTHALFHAAGLYVPEKGKVPEHVLTEAKDIAEDSDLDLIREGSVGSVRSKKRSVAEWQSVLSTDKELNEIWHELHFRFRIGDPEGTGDIRGMDVADESRYGTDPRGEPLGHAYDAVTEFIASFVASSQLFPARMADTVRASKSAALAELYQRLWKRVDSTLVSLGSTNPFDAVVKDLSGKKP